MNWGHPNRCFVTAALVDVKKGEEYKACKKIDIKDYQRHLWDIGKKCNGTMVKSEKLSLLEWDIMSYVSMDLGHCRKNRNLWEGQGIALGYILCEQWK